MKGFYIGRNISLNPREFASMIDHTLLKPDADYRTLEKYVNDVREYGFKLLMLPLSLLDKALEIAGKTIRYGVVVGFPLGNTSTRVKVYEAVEAVSSGASEVDMVMNISLFKSREYLRVLEDISAVVLEARKRGVESVKVIIETTFLDDAEKIKAVELVAQAGADYVKTNTGFLGGGATVHDVALLYRASQGRVKVKASGGIRHALDALSLIEAGASRIGTSNGDRLMKEFLELTGEA
uniref:Deoxyribose-phosphate aldolase n=1 Tax=Thermosphaera aggregans TaxID=54254 RepID=A0A7C2BLP0_9CREN